MKEELTKLIDENEVISFDVFDTVLFRNISRPTDLFYALNNEIEEKFKIKDFGKKRIDAETEARKYTKTGEVTLKDIYKYFKIENNKKSCIRQLMKIEVERELDFICENRFMKQIYSYCIQKKKKVFFISDMYLSSDSISKLLNKCGFKVNNNLYVSSECDMLKCNGTLFEYVKKDNNLSFERWLHIGDSIESDYNQPKRLGMNAYYYKNINSYEINNSKSVFESIILGIRNIMLYSGINNSYWSNFGYKCLVPLYLGYANWIYYMTYNSDNLFFLARDGYIIKKIYELFPNDNNKYIDYLYISRNSIQVPTLFRNDKDILLEIYKPNKKNIRLIDHFKRCNLEVKDEFLNIIKLYGFNSFNDIIDEESIYNVQKCIAACWQDKTKEMNENYELAKEYLIQERLNDFESPCVVDIGWGGSLQDSIRQILGRNITGYYFGTIQTGKKDYMTNSFGYMFDLNNPDLIKNKIFEQVMMYEFVFSAPHGSTLRYEKSNGEIKPIFDKKDSYSKIIGEFQDSSYELIKEIMKYYEYYDSLSFDFCLEFYDNFLHDYNYDDLIEFKNFESDFELGDKKKFPYIVELDPELFLGKIDYKRINKEINTSLWKGSFLIKNCNKKQFEFYKSKLDEAIKESSSPPFYIKVWRRIVPLKIRKTLKKILKL